MRDERGKRDKFWMNLPEYYLRWRHTRGYGVHSPYAFRFVTEVLRPGGYGYYAYHKADHLAASPKYDAWSARKEIYFYIRLFIFLDIRCVTVLGNKDMAMEIAMKSLEIKCVKSSGEPNGSDLIFINVKEGNEDSGFIEVTIDKAISLNIPILTIGGKGKIRKKLEQPLEKGLMFFSPDKLLLIPRKEMEYVNYSINL